MIANVEANPLTSETQNEIAQKMGRNLLLCQQVEGAIKSLLAQRKTEGDGEMDRQTLGQAVNKFGSDVLYCSEEIAVAPRDTQPIEFSFCFTAAINPAYCDELKKSLAFVVAERNDLVHHLHQKFDLSTMQGAQKAVTYLDTQHTAIVPTFASLQRLATGLQTIKQTAPAYFSSSEVARYFAQAFPAENKSTTPPAPAKPPTPEKAEKRITALLREIAAQKTRPDGWAVLQAAEQVIRQKAANDLDVLKKQPEQKTFLALVSALADFETQGELTKNGGVRTLYRVKPTK